MTDLSPQRTRSPMAAIRAWWRGLIGHDAAEFRYCEDAEVAEMAKDAGVSVNELLSLARMGPKYADLLARRMAALDLDPAEVGRIEPQTLHDLQRVCTMCKSHGRCARDLARDANDPAWESYCPNCQTLEALGTLPWASRSEF